MQFQFVSFQQDLLAEVFNSEPLGNTLFVLPTESSKRAAIRLFQKRWLFESAAILTMEELKSLLIVPDKPLLKEEKRTLAFYAALNDDDKKQFNIHNYAQAIELAHSFFGLWEEFNEERLDEHLDLAVFEENDAEFLNWQRRTWERLCAIKAQYREWIESRGFTDMIFWQSPENLQLQALGDVERISVINQFYYTGFEKELLRTAESAGKPIKLFYQLPRSLIDTETLDVRPFGIEELGSGRCQSIQISEATNDFGMLTGFLKTLDDGNIRNVIDAEFLLQTYERFLSPQFFQGLAPQSFTNTSVVHLLNALHQLFSGLVFEPHKGKILLPLAALLDAFLDDSFSTYIFKDEPKARDAVLVELYRRLDDGVKFVDMEADFLRARPDSPAAPHIQAVIDLVKKLQTVQTIADWVQLIDRDHLDIERVFTKAELLSTNIREAFYRALGDFQAIEAIGLVTDWSDYFDPYRESTQSKISAGILKLFIDYLKPRSLRQDTIPPDQPRTSLTSLLDARNLTFKSLAMVNVVEGSLPHRRTPLFLFTEKQRQLLGLKTYEDIKLREKYYFLRLVLTTPDVHLFTQNNEDENIDISSFVEEVRLHFGDKVQTRPAPKISFQTVYDEFLDVDDDYQAPSDRPANFEFYTIPSDPAVDYPYENIRLGPYAYGQLRDNPLHYFLNTICRIKQAPHAGTPDMSPLVIGNFAHEWLNTVWRQLLDEAILPPYQMNFADVDPARVDAVLEKLVWHRDFYFHYPHDHRHIYFQEFVLPRLREGILGFFRYLDAQGLGNRPLQIFPEKEEATTHDAYKPFMSAKDNPLKLPVAIGGRADLRIETEPADQYWIVDYKTGKKTDADQLLMYELTYYRIDSPHLGDEVQSFFYNLFDHQAERLQDIKSNRKRVTPEERRQLFYEKLLAALSGIAWSGYALAERKSKMNNFTELSRKDLYLTRYNKPETE